MSHQIFDLLFFLVTPAIFASDIFQFYIRSIQVQKHELFLPFYSYILIILKKCFFCWDINFVLYSFFGLSFYILLCSVFYYVHFFFCDSYK